MISLVTVIYSLLFVVVQWVSGAFSMRLALFRDDPIVWRAFAYSIGLFVFCFTAAFAIGNDQRVSVVVPCWRSSWWSALWRSCGSCRPGVRIHAARADADRDHRARPGDPGRALSARPGRAHLSPWRFLPEDGP